MGLRDYFTMAEGVSGLSGLTVRVCSRGCITKSMSSSGTAPNQHGVSQHEGAGETRAVLEPYLKRADIRDEMGFSVRGRDLASFDGGQVEL